MKTIAIGAFLDFDMTLQYIGRQLLRMISPNCTEKYVFLPYAKLVFHLNTCSVESCPQMNIAEPYIIFDSTVIPIRFDRYDDMIIAIVETMCKLRAKICRFCGTLCKVRSKICACCDARLRHASDMLALQDHKDRTCCICLGRMKKPMTFDCSDHLGCAKCVLKYNRNNISNDNRFICPYRCDVSKLCSSYSHAMRAHTIIEQHEHMHSEACLSSPQNIQVSIDPIYDEDNEEIREIIEQLENINRE